ncbi:ribokinase [Candidatus Bipolaricaulota bacterium]|nr:ribokinase [Candidatus Bipolaricaulota bacterium]
MSSKIAVFGSINMDQMARVERFPRPGETLKGEEYKKVPGGKGANQAVSSARLGADVSMYGLVGEDVFGEELVSNLENDGVRTDYLETRNVSTGLALIQVDDSGENQIVIISGANGEVDEKYVDRNLDTILNNDVLLLQLEIPFKTIAYLLEKLSSTNQRTPTVVLDPAPARDLSDLELSPVDFLTPNEGELEQLLDVKNRDRLVKKILGKGVEALVITKGEGGADYISGKESFSVPGFSVQVEDTTAAGDAFTGAFSVGLSSDAGLRDIIEFANAAGGLAAAVEGAQPSLPDRNSVVDFLEKRSEKNHFTRGED